jgi:hypothetical protein
MQVVTTSRTSGIPSETPLEDQAFYEHLFRRVKSKIMKGLCWLNTPFYRTPAAARRGALDNAACAATHARVRAATVVPFTGW